MITLSRKMLGALLGLSVGVSGATAAGCSSNAADGQDDEAEAQEGELRPLERKAIGKAVDYAADKTLRSRLEELESSRKARRAAAWKAVGRVLAPVKVADPNVKAGDKAATVPVFRTWYGKDDFERMFGKMYADRTAADRKARRPFTATDAKRAFDWNATALGSSSDKDYFERIQQVKDDTSVQGLGGNHRVAYSPGIFSHLMGEYGSLFACLPKLDANAIKPDEEPISKTNFAPCFSQEFPVDAALVKMSWYRANFGAERLPLPTYDTSAKTLKAKMSASDADQGAWGKGVGTADPDEASIYTVGMADGTKFRMPAMHLVTKELREWLWITIWWSDKPNEDFGADRPAEITNLDGPWKNYKMNVSVSYEEKDPDPRGGFDGSLGDALEAAYTGVGKPSWASNPYLEKGAPNAQSNCIGCHQHAGTNENSESILFAPDKFPEASRTRIRKNFPADYLWAVTSAPERLAGVIDDQVKHYDQVDR
ncbi:MAG: hypothetical protein JWP87_2161 [Labilithrix sp.]|nr:hypothetical protein [Labilithrix sp.]